MRRRPLKQFWKKHCPTVIGSLLLALLSLAVISVIAVFGGVVMTWFGFTYRSIGSIILFFVLATALSLPISLFAKALPRVLLFRFGYPRGAAVALFVVLDTLATFAGLRIVDRFMASVAATDTAILVVSLLLALWSIKDMLEPPKDENA